jgi:hypothetical protein
VTRRKKTRKKKAPGKIMSTNQILKQIENYDEQLKRIPNKIKVAKLDLTFRIKNLRRSQKSYRKKINELKARLKERELFDAHAKKHYPDLAKEEKEEEEEEQSGC